MLHRKNVKLLVGCAVMLLTLLSTVVPALAKSKSAEPLVAVVGHLALPGSPAVQMFMQEHRGQQYLLIKQASEQGFTIVNVTKPGNAAIVKQVAWPNHASTGQLQLVKTGLLLSTVSENNPAPANGGAATQTLNLLDLSDPANPQIVQTFTGVTTMLVDQDREFVYLANAEGLWILKCKLEEPEPNPFGCPADGSMSTDPNCSN